MKKQNGFTLMELIIVIVVLGILSAFVIPKYMSLDVEARTSTIKGLNGSIQAAAEMVHGIALAKGYKTAGIKDLGTGLIVNITSKSYPTASSDGISSALASTSGFAANTSIANTIRYDADGGTTPNCSVAYSITDTANSPTITPTTSGC